MMSELIVSLVNGAKLSLVCMLYVWLCGFCISEIGVVGAICFFDCVFNLIVNMEYLLSNFRKCTMAVTVSKVYLD